MHQELVVTFFKQKKHLGMKIIKLVKDKMNGKLDKQVSRIRCDNIGENKLMEKLMKAEGLGISFEYGARKTLQ